MIEEQSSYVSNMLNEISIFYNEFIVVYVSYFYEFIYTLPILTILQNNVAIISVTLYFLWYIKAYLSRTELICKDGSKMKLFIEKLESFHSGYRPTMWCFPSISNTIFFYLMQRIIKHDYKREILRTPDGGQIAIDWANLESKNKLILLVLPGLTGSSKEGYVSHFVDKAVKADCKAVVMNYRGIEVDLLTPRTYCATNFEDLHLVIENIKTKYPDHLLFGVGISMGGIKLSGYLAKFYDDCFISNAMIISAPFNVFKSADELEKSQYMFFNKLLLNTLSKYLHKNKHLFENDKRYDFHAISRCRSLRDLDTHFVTKQFGYDSCEQYYKEACIDSKLQDIRVPTLFLNAADDMFSPERAFPIEKFQSNPNIGLVMTKYGGHISFAEGLFPTGCNYACRLLKDYLQNVLNDMNQGSQK